MVNNSHFSLTYTREDTRSADEVAQPGHYEEARSADEVISGTVLPVPSASEGISLRLLAVTAGESHCERSEAILVPSVSEGISVARRLSRRGDQSILFEFCKGFLLIF
ncbi:hypothetical protein Thein_2122 [Thermodesulfatator indicus DSM 15286]|uniref:Uncharacterized protein n=1 Tax=Thermodesulfatator indicus (strain DSM 15286 / JCM 11887 / CIR29812) TaxID=667014 RepID=F8ADF4_THEID|nr:hypothetical protein Thein_2122 [Thermodesulfatator indicus DSM 15286]